MTNVRTHSYISFANPFLRCDTCSNPVGGYHDPEKCGCESDFRNVPCGHLGSTSICLSWGPVDGCRCSGNLVDHSAEAGDPDA